MIYLALPNSISVKKRLLFVLFGFSAVLILLILRVGWLQLVQGNWLQMEAHKNYTHEKKINSQRGTIYDRNGKALAISASVETVTVNPSEVKNSKNVKPEQIAETLSKILQMDYKEVYDKITKNTRYEVIKRKIDKPIADEIRKAQAEKKLPGISVDDDKKRFYPNGNFASYIIGFTGVDNQGLDGIEVKYDKYLRGIPGRIISATDRDGREVPNSDEQFVNPKNGEDIYLTIDEVIQHFAEKALETAVDNSKVKKGSVIVMDPKTGEILALAVKPDYNLNTPFDPIDENLISNWSSLSAEQKSIERQKMWRNPVISDTYEPGSTFKIITSASALEENVVKPTDMFNDVGYVMVGGHKIKCWDNEPHGLQTFVQGVQNSCNPVFIEVSQRMGIEKFYNYIKGFGFMERTGIDLPGETADTIFHKLSNMGPVELATYSFGQGFQITPMQMITAVSAIANDGKLLKPRIVKQIKDIDGNVVKNFEPEFVRQVVSKDTSILLRNILESVVTEGTGKNAYVKGYRVAGKTGTSEKLPRGNGKYIASFACFAPADDPKIAVLVILDEPSAGIYYGGQIAAPVARQIVDDTLRYLEVEPKYTPKELEEHKEVSVPDITNKPLNDALKILKGSNLAYKIEGDGNTVIGQMPKAGFKIIQNSPVFIFLNKSAQNSKRIVPDVIGKTISDSSRILAEAGLNIKIVGSGHAAHQNPAAGTEVEPGSIINVDFRDVGIRD